MVVKLSYTLPNAIEIAQLEKVCFQKDAWSLNAVRSEFQNTFSHIFAYIENDGIIGYVCARDAADELQVCNLAVTPECRRNGVATKLINNLISFAKTNGSAKIFLEVNTQNKPACALYEKCGFTVAGVRKNFYRQSRYPTRDAYTLVYEVNGESGAEK